MEKEDRLGSTPNDTQRSVKSWSAESFRDGFPHLEDERVIRQNNEAPRKEIENRWMLFINNRFKFDRAQTYAAKYGSKSLKKSLVQKTWTKVIENESYLPKDWMREAEVLVGIG
ncbi:hypothetical protein C8R43DRAFT_1187199 [Mycena crocata]|nr:hypothetical protein C8R43DRAFT_1187199 [Mycena crocata]